MNGMEGLVGRLRLTGQAFVPLLLTIPALVLFSTVLTFGTLAFVSVLVPLFLLEVRKLRGLADVHRLWCARVLDMPIARPYPPDPPGGLRLKNVLSDRATWRDFAWTFVDATAGLTILSVAVALPAAVVFHCTILLYYYAFPDIASLGFVHGLAGALVNFLIGLILLALWWRYLPALLRAYGRMTRALLRPSDTQTLARRVEQLASSRAETVDAQAAELRRIERDLHDGAQARLVALGMSLGLADEMVEQNPAAARELLAEARQASSSALSELRNLVRGIHPPVLADRGLPGAVEALAMATPLPTDVEIDLPGRLPAPVESAAYFAVAEAVANVIKHSGAHKAWIRVAYADERLSLLVGDDGRGGADPAAGSGLRGIERRLTAFDGTLFVASPPGGPTVVTMELPCALSSPKTSPS